MEQGFYKGRFNQTEIIVWLTPLSKPTDAGHAIVALSSAAPFVKADEPGTRWITLKPNGQSSDAYVHVKIRMNPNGSAHVVGGPKGLRGLRLSKLVKKKKRDPSKKVKKPKKELTPEEAEKAEASKKELDTQLGAAKKKALEAAAALTGDDTFMRGLDPNLANDLEQVLGKSASEASDDPNVAAQAASTVAKRQIKKLDSALTTLNRNVLDELLKDDDLKKAVLGTEEIDASNEVKPSTSKGYRYGTEKRAAEQDFTREDAKAEAEAFFKERVKEVEKKDPGKAERMVRAREDMKARADVSSEIKDDAEEALPTPSKRLSGDLLKKAQHARALITANRAIKALKRDLRRVEAGKDPNASREESEALEYTLRDTPEFSVTDVPDDLKAKLERDLSDAEAENVSNSFFSEIENSEQDPKNVRRHMAKHLGKGAHAHLNNLNLAALGAESVDRAVVDTLGVEAAAKLSAHALTRQLGDTSALRASLENYHGEVSTKKMEAATEAAAQLRAEAAKVEIPELSSAHDAAAVAHLIEAKRDALEAAHKELGTALGEVEAGAALNLALANTPKSLRVNLGSSAEQAALALRALGLKEDDYEFVKDAKGGVWADINADGMDALTPEADPQESELRAKVAAIKRGDEDEADWLPNGFVSYSAASFATERPEQDAYAVNPLAGADVGQATKDALASRLADGWSPAEIMRVMNRQSFSSTFAQDEGAYQAALAQHMPATSGSETVELSDGTSFERDIPVDYDNLEDKHPDIHQNLQQLKNDYLAANGLDQDYDGQTITDTALTRKAMHQALLAAPSSQLAFKPLGKVTRAETKGFREYFVRSVLGLTPKELAQQDQNVKAAIEKFDEQNDEPEKFNAGMFGTPDVSLKIALEHKERLLKDMGLNGQHFDVKDGRLNLNQLGKDALTLPKSKDLEHVEGLESLNPAFLEHGRLREKAAYEAGADLPGWTDFAQTVGGPQKAYQLLQDHMKSAFFERFSKHLANSGGPNLKLGRKAMPEGELLMSLSDPEAHKRLLELRRDQQDDVRERTGGKFKAMGGKGSVLEAARSLREAERSAKGMQGAMFGAGEDEGARDDFIPHLESHDLPKGVTERLGRMVNASSKSLSPHMSPVHLIPDVTMGKGTKFAKQQRMIKTIEAAKHHAAFFGTGSGKTSISIGAFTHLEGKGKAKKGVFAVPAAVRDQFGEEMARMLEPGKYGWHAQNATHEDRLAAYKHPETHMVAVTHAAFRDDMTTLMGKHLGGDGLEDRFMNASPERRQSMLKEALDKEGIPLDYLAMDEAHDSLNRAGKSESMLSAVADAAYSLSKFGTMMTGTPVKNDASEMHDWLKKQNPQKFGDREKFMRNYGTDVHTSQEALKRAAEPYVTYDVVDAGTTKSVTWGDASSSGDSPSGHTAIGLSEFQQGELEAVDSAYAAARRARRAGGVDVAALKRLSPNSFKDAPEDEHEAIATNLSSSLGTLRHAAHARAINDAPAKDNAKIQHLLKMADSRRGKGGVVFARSRESVKQITQALEGAGHTVTTLTGSHSGKEKAKSRNAFNGGEADIIVVSDAGASGLNLQKRGKWLAQHDLPMTAMLSQQRSARIDRLGQKDEIEIHHLMSDSDYDRANQKRIEKKSQLGSIWQGQAEVMDETGLAQDLRLQELVKAPQ